MHVDILELGKKYLDLLFPDSVFIGFLAPAPGSHVRKKCEKEHTMKKKHRLAMVELVAKETDWVQPVQQCYGSALHCCEDYLRATETISRKGVFVVEVVGGDRAKPARKAQGNRLCITISRKGEDNKLATFLQRTVSKRGLFAGLPPPDESIHLDGNDMFIVLPGAELEKESVSSSMIREVLAEVHSQDNFHSKQTLLNHLVDRNQLSPLVADYILQNEQDLYES
jgi:hypothetical protein